MKLLARGSFSNKTWESSSSIAAVNANKAGKVTPRNALISHLSWKLCAGLVTFLHKHLLSRASKWVHMRLIQGDSGGVTATYGAHFWRHFEQKVSYKPGYCTQYLQIYVRIWKHTTVNCVWPSLT
jgi:hypothetical protein